MMVPEDQVRLAEILAAARRQGRQVDALPERLVPGSSAQGYAVAARVSALLGWERLGWKIAGTTPVMREKLRVSEPIYGPAYKRFAMPSPGVLAHAELLDPLVECEFFVILGRDLAAREAPWTLAEVVDAIAEVRAGIEVAECRFPMAKLPAVPAILADGSASGRYVFGEVISGWREGLAAVDVVMEVDGAVRRRGSGAEVMGDPLVPLLWLAEERRRWGDGLLAGELVSTGTTTGMLPARAGQKVRAVFGGRAEVRVDFDG
jgi:2-keto-4-pentenoate hydratase